MVPVPEPDLTPSEMIGRAVALRPMLLDEQADAEQRGYYSASVHTAFVEAGFYRALQPRRFGGYEFDVPTFFKLVVEIARGGSGGVGWCLSLGTGHALILGAHWPGSAQADIFGPDGHFIAPHRAAPAGSIVLADGGYRVSGRWRYSSGIPYATHFMGTAPLVVARSESSADPPTLLVFLLPRDQFEMLHDWGGGADLGLQASGSNTVVIEDAFVPAHHVISADWRTFDQTDGTYGTRLHGNPMYLGINGGFYHGELVACQVGTARAALDEYERILTTSKTRTAPQVLQFQHRDFQQAFGLAMSMTDAAEAILIHAAETYMAYCQRWAEQGVPFSQEDDLRLWATLQQAGRLTWEALEALWTAAPPDAAKRGARLQRYYRDLSMYRLHGSSRTLFQASRVACAHFGLPIESLFG
jgi:3-hydroxy-9,10-secoandrosta-1,3,5(10)-triene-9,17-dione monooxygenase